MPIDHNKNLYWLRDAKLNNRYLVMGKPWDLVPSLSFLEGMREKAEQVSFMLQRLWPRKALCSDQNILKAWQSLNDAIEVDRAFLLDTHWYKQTMFIGPIIDKKGEAHFIKYFKTRDDAALALHQSDFMDAHFGGYFKTVSARVINDVVALYPLIEHSVKAVPFDALMRSTFDTAKHLYDLHLENTKPLNSFITLDMPIMFKKHEASSVWRQVREFVEICGTDMVSMTPIHGDMVPWNIFHDDQGALTLVDYERCGWHVPFYDFFHLIVQPSCMKAKVIDAPALWADIKQDRQNTVIWFILYLLDQLRFDMDSYYNQQQQYPRLKKAIDIKLNLLETALKEIHDDI